MIIAEKATKKFDAITAINEISCKIPVGCIYGMVGSNGAGKSTFLRLITGIYQADGGVVTVNGQSVFDNPSVKKTITFVPDELYFLGGASMNRMAKLYASVYETFDYNRFYELTSIFRLDPKRNIGTFSKGMKRQAAIILCLSCRTQYIFFDETFDGLDPVMRNLVKNIICEDVLERSATAIITSHSLRELEDTCDQLALLHRGGIVFESDIENIKTSLFKIQCAFSYEYDKELFDGIDILNFSKRGSVCNMIVRGDRDKTTEAIKALFPTLLDVLPLSLEEVFIYEMEVLGYSFNDIFDGFPAAAEGETSK